MKLLIQIGFKVVCIVMLFIIVPDKFAFQGRARST